MLGFLTCDSWVLSVIRLVNRRPLCLDGLFEHRGMANVFVQRTKYVALVLQQLSKLLLEGTLMIQNGDGGFGGHGGISRGRQNNSYSLQGAHTMSCAQGERFGSMIVDSDPQCRTAS